MRRKYQCSSEMNVQTKPVLILIAFMLVQLFHVAAFAEQEPSVAMLKKAADAVAGKGGHVEVKARYDLAQAQLKAADYEGALPNYVWLWKNIKKQDPIMTKTRGTTMASEMKKLVLEYAPAREQIVPLRGESERSDRRDWITLNMILGEDDMTLEWFDSIKGERAKHDLFQVECQIEKLLVKKGRLVDVTALYPNPVSELRSKFFVWKAGQMFTNQPDSDVGTFPEEAAVMYAAFLAAGKDDLAAKVAEEGLKLQDTPDLRERLKSAAQNAKPPRQLVLKEKGAYKNEMALYIQGLTLGITLLLATFVTLVVRQVLKKRKMRAEATH